MMWCPGWTCYPAAILRQAGEVKAMLANQGLTPEFVSPRLWFDPRTIDSGYTSKSGNPTRWTSPRSARNIPLAGREIPLAGSHPGRYVPVRP